MTESSPEEDDRKVEGDAPPPGGRRKTVMRAAKWTFVGHGMNQVLRLASSIIMANLLPPELLGRMELVWTVLTGVQLLSDVGSGPSIIQDNRGDDERFLNTAWTIQVVRGLILTLVVALIAWPITGLYGREQLYWPLVATGFTAAISGFDSISIHTEKRHLNVGAVVRIELLATIFSIGSMITVAMFSQTVWPMVVGGVVSAATVAVSSHFLLRPHKHRLEFDRDCAKDMFRFGRWVFLSTAFTYLAGSGDKYLVGYLSEAALGIYSRAGRFTAGITGLMFNLNHNLLFPLLSQARREGKDVLVSIYRKSRLRYEALFVSACGGLVGFGQAFIELIYPEAYHEAGTFLIIMATRSAVTSALAPGGTLLTAMGKSYYGFLRNSTETAWMAVALPLGFHFGGVYGVVLAAASAVIPNLIVVWAGLIKNGVFSLWIETRPTLFFVAGVGLGWVATQITQAIQAALL